MSNRFLTQQFRGWRTTGNDLVLVTVVETAGSTYSKTGRQLLINGTGDYAGLVGGGCLEGDIVQRANEVLTDGKPQLVTYDMRDDADDLWGLGLGCRGMMRLLIQRLTAADNWEPFTTLARIMEGSEATRVALALTDSKTVRCGQLVAPDDSVDSVSWTLQPWPRLLLLGAGPDAGPVVELAATLGWQITVADHRDELLAASALAAADERLRVTPADIGNAVQLADFDAVCVMSHHLHSDIEYLHGVSKIDHAYVGVLGPAARKNEILQQLENRGDAVTDEFRSRLRGPVGLDIGADSPQEIALALIAQIQDTLSRKTARQINHS